MRLLLVEDEEDLAEGVRLGLNRAGYAVDVAGTVAAAGERLSVHPYDVVLLDINLPDGDGFSVCRSIRSGELATVGADEPRILMLTARDSLLDRVQGLDDGADDYLVKPFALAELSARVRALLRRDVRPGGTVLAVGPLRLDQSRHEATRDERALQLSRKEFGVLEYLMTKPGHVIPAEELLEHVWDENTDPFTHTVRVTVGTLRRKITHGDEQPLITTVVGRGYRLVGG